VSSRETITMSTSMIQGAPEHDPPEVIALVAEAMPLVDPIVRQLRTLFAISVEQDDLVALGYQGALIAARTFDKVRYVPFDRWATVKIRGAIIDGLRREAQMSRRLHARLRGLAAANDAEEGLLDEGASSPPSSPEAADERLTDYLAAIATSMAAGTMMISDAEVLDAIEDERGTVEDETIREELKAYVRAAIAEQPAAEREILERYYFEGKPLDQASGGLSRSWSSRLLARGMSGVARSLKRANFER
jgi:RNA polymerase sigma factor for flagellar operon FliA